MAPALIVPGFDRFTPGLACSPAVRLRHDRHSEFVRPRDGRLLRSDCDWRIRGRPPIATDRRKSVKARPPAPAAGSRHSDKSRSSPTSERPGPGSTARFPPRERFAKVPRAPSVFAPGNPWLAGPTRECQLYAVAYGPSRVITWQAASTNQTPPMPGSPFQRHRAPSPPTVAPPANGAAPAASSCAPAQ